MKVALVLALIGLSLAAKSNVDVTSGFSEYTFEQSVDHFNYSNKDTYSQRYWKNSDYWESDRPVMLFLGGDSPVDMESLSSIEAPFQMATEMSALMLVLETRFFGESQPVTDWELTNMKFLNIE